MPTQRRSRSASSSIAPERNPSRKSSLDSQHMRTSSPDIPLASLVRHDQSSQDVQQSGLQILSDRAPESSRDGHESPLHPASTPRNEPIPPTLEPLGGSSHPPQSNGGYLDQGLSTQLRIQQFDPSKLRYSDSVGSKEPKKPREPKKPKEPKKPRKPRSTITKSLSPTSSLKQRTKQHSQRPQPQLSSSAQQPVRLVHPYLPHDPSLPGHAGSNLPDQASASSYPQRRGQQRDMPPPPVPAHRIGETRVPFSDVSLPSGPEVANTTVASAAGKIQGFHRSSEPQASRSSVAAGSPLGPMRTPPHKRRGDVFVSQISGSPRQLLQMHRPRQRPSQANPLQSSFTPVFDGVHAEDGNPFDMSRGSDRHSHMEAGPSSASSKREGKMVVRSNAQPRSVPIAPAPLAVTPTGTLPEAGEAERRNGQREMHLNDPVGHGHIEGSLFRASNLFEKWSAAHPGRIFHRPHIHSPLEDPVIVWRHPLPNPKAPADIVEGHSQLLIGEWNAIGCSKKQMPAGLHGVVFSSSQDLLEVCGDTVVLFVGSLDVKPNMYLYYGQYIVEDAGRTISQEAWSAMAPAARLVMIGMMGPLFSTEEEYVRRHTRMFRLRFVGYDSQFAMRG